MSFEQLAILIKKVLSIYKCVSSTENFKDLGYNKDIGRLNGINITNPIFVFTSVTGLYQKVVDFSGDK